MANKNERILKYHTHHVQNHFSALLAHVSQQLGGENDSSNLVPAHLKE